MKQKILIVATILMLLVAAFPVAGAKAVATTPSSPIPVDISSKLKDRRAPAQPSVAEAAEAVAASATTSPQCGGDGETKTITIPSFDAANPIDQDVVFWKESVGNSASLWVAWDFLATAYGRQDVVTCDMLTYLQGSMDSIVSTDVYYFGDYVQRPAGNANIDVMIYNIVDESYFDSSFPFYIAGFFWNSINEAFNDNMVFIDSLDWANRLGGNDAAWRGTDSSLWRPFTYEGTVAHELEHLIHNDHDYDEDSWIDEGMADLAIYLNGYGHDDGHVVYYLAFHRTPLTTWSSALENYGASYLFQLYLLENYGEKDGSSFTGWSNTWTRHEMNTQENSIAGVEAATGRSFNDLYDAWIVANYLDNPAQKTASGLPVGYKEIDLAPFNSDTYGPWSIQRGITDIYNGDHHGNLPVNRYYGGYVSGTVEFPQGEVTPYTPVYGLYKGMEPQLGVYLRGNAQSGIAPHGGTHEAASGSGHMLTDRILSLNTPVGGTLSFWTWYDIEEEWDYGFVEASTDGGATWAPLAGSITRSSTDPNDSTAWQNSLLGDAASSNTVITGNSGGWVQATFNLPAASNVLVRFSYYTDEAVNGQGWFIDDLTVNGVSEDFETGTDGWTLGGWSNTTGLFNNDWIAGYINPSYSNNRLQSIAWGFLDGTISGAYEIINGLIDTSRLNKHAATVFFANRPGETPFNAGYTLLVKKGTAAP
jgi:hypothetical protein